MDRRDVPKITPIIDIHTHVLYGLDDGSQDLEMTMKLIDIEYEQGVRGIFLTNHSYGLAITSDYGGKATHNEELYYEKYLVISDAVKEKYPDLKLFTGCEILCSSWEMGALAEYIQEGIYPTMNGTRYVLLEFEPHETDGVSEMIECLEFALNKGYIPIIAHAERYGALYDDALSDVIRMRELGCKVQINLYSVEQDRGSLGGSRRELANLFLEHHLVDFVGTDTHNLTYKSPEAAVGAAAIRAKYGDEYADEVLFKNAEKMLM